MWKLNSGTQLPNQTLKYSTLALIELISVTCSECYIDSSGRTEGEHSLTSAEPPGLRSVSAVAAAWVARPCIHGPTADATTTQPAGCFRPLSAQSLQLTRAGEPALSVQHPTGSFSPDPDPAAPSRRLSLGPSLPNHTTTPNFPTRPIWHGPKKVSSSPLPNRSHDCHGHPPGRYSGCLSLSRSLELPSRSDHFGHHLLSTSAAQARSAPSCDSNSITQLLGSKVGVGRSPKEENFSQGRESRRR